MSEERIHRAVSDDGTEIAGRVHGQGPPLVLVPGAMGDGETIWEPLMPLLTDRFTCFAMSTRGRGLSGQATEFSSERLVEDVTSFVDSIGDPVYLAGWSQGALLSLGAVQESDAVAAVAPFEPPVFQVMTDQLMDRLMRTVSSQGELAAEGLFVDAARVFVEDLVANEDERAALPERFYEVLAPNIPVHLQEMQALAARAPDDPSINDPARLATITVPVLVLHGTRSVPGSWFIDGARHVAEHVADPHVRSMGGVGHIAPYLEPRAVADELTPFFAGAGISA